MTFKFILGFIFGLFSLLTKSKIPSKDLYAIQTFILIFICIYYYLLTSRSPASFRACSLLVSIEIFKWIGLRVKFLDLLVGVFVVTGIILGKELLSTGNMLSWSCYLTVYFFHKQNFHPTRKSIYMYSCLTFIGASFFMNFNLLSPVINLFFLPTFILLFSGLILTFMLMNMIQLGESTTQFIVKHLENYFILLDEWTFYVFRHFEFKVQSGVFEGLLPLITLCLLGLMTYKLETHSPRTLIEQ